MFIFGVATTTSRVNELLKWSVVLVAWWRHQMETFSALLAICAGNSPVADEFPAQRPVMRSFDVFFDLRPNKRLSKQWWGWWFETLSSPLWRHCSVQNLKIYYKYKIAKLPQYFMNMFTINADIHPYGSRQSSHLRHGVTRTTKARKKIIDKIEWCTLLTKPICKEILILRSLDVKLVEMFNCLSIWLAIIHYC